MAEALAARQSELNRAVNQRLDGMSHKIGATLAEQTKSSMRTCGNLQERLAVIDSAQNNIQSLAKDVVGPAGYSFEQADARRLRTGRMEAIVADALRNGAYEFQAVLAEWHAARLPDLHA